MPIEKLRFDSLVEKVEKATMSEESTFSQKSLGVEGGGFKSMPTKHSNIDKIATAVNFLVNLCHGLVDTVNHQAARLKVLEEEKTKLEEVKEKLEEVKVKMVTNVREAEAKVEVKMMNLEEETDNVKQRSMEGCITVSSPHNTNKETRFINLPITDQFGTDRTEQDVEMVLRVVGERSLVKFPVEEVEACYPLEQGRDGRRPTNWFVKFKTRRVGSQWHTLAAGMRTGFNPDTKTGFPEANIYLNHPLTPRRARFLKEVVKVAHREKKVGKYMVDERGSIWAKKVKGGRFERGDQFKYWPVTTKEEVERVAHGDFDYFITKKNNNKT